jgi:hypothetical protein
VKYVEMIDRRWWDEEGMIKDIIVILWKVMMVM